MTLQQPSQRSPFLISTHAFERFAERICPQFTPGRARAEAVVLARSARRTDQRLPDVSEIWEATDGAPIRFVVKNNDARGPTAVTVLAADDPLPAFYEEETP